MKQTKHLKRGRVSRWALPIVFAAFLATGTAAAQHADAPHLKEAIIESLQSTNSAKTEVGPSDQTLLEKAMSNPEFLGKLEDVSGTIYVMMHGIAHQNISGFTFRGKPVELLDKTELLAVQPQHFFIVKDFQRNENSAFIDMDFHYNFDGTYSTYIQAESLLAKLNGQWTNQHHSSLSTQ